MSPLFGHRNRRDPLTPEQMLAEGNTRLPPVDVRKNLGPDIPSGFRMPVEDVFSIKGRGTVVTGKVTSGSVSTGMTIMLVRGGTPVRPVTVRGVEMFRKKVDRVEAGDNVGLLLDAVHREEFLPGDELIG